MTGGVRAPGGLGTSAFGKTGLQRRSPRVYWTGVVTDDQPAPLHGGRGAYNLYSRVSPQPRANLFLVAPPGADFVRAEQEYCATPLRGAAGNGWKQAVLLWAPLTPHSPDGNGSCVRKGARGPSPRSPSPTRYRARIGR